MSAKYIKVKRHSLFFRLCHWGIVFTGILLGITGLQLAGFIRIFSDAYALHIRLAFIFAGLWGFFIYLHVAEEWKWVGLGRIPYSIRFITEEAKAWFKGKHVEDPRAYDPEKKEYIEKVVPSQIVVWWVYLILTIIVGITGLALYNPVAFKPVIDFGAAIAPIFGTLNGYAMIRAIHLFVMFLYATVLIMHAYAATIYGTLPSMISGFRREKVATKVTYSGDRKSTNG